MNPAYWREDANNGDRAVYYIISGLAYLVRSEHRSSAADSDAYHPSYLAPQGAETLVETS